mgnify:CR=1 FL=1
MTQGESIAIGLCTYRRPSVAETLASLGRLQLPGSVKVSVIVADNDTTPTGEDIVRNAGAGLPFPATYLFAPANNISVARNAILQAARTSGARYLAFLDDDETVDSAWLVTLLDAVRDSQCACAIGPVQADYHDTAPPWMRRGRMHDTVPKLDPEGFAVTGYSCNTLIDLCHPALAGCEFDPARGKTGGEDTAFFDRILRQGGRIAYAPQAIAYEVVPPERARLGWLLRRRFRMGQTHGDLMLRDAGPLRRAAQATTAGAKALACLALGLGHLANPVKRNGALVRGALHLGNVSVCAGSRTLDIYGTKPLGASQRPSN